MGGMMRLFRKRPRLTRAEAVASAASYLARHAAEQRRKARSTRTAEHIAALRASPVSPIADRDAVVEPVRALREIRHA